MGIKSLLLSQLRKFHSPNDFYPQHTIKYQNYYFKAAKHQRFYLFYLNGHGINFVAENWITNYILKKVLKIIHPSVTYRNSCH